MHPHNEHSPVEDGNHLNGLCYVQCSLHYFMHTEHFKTSVQQFVCHSTCYVVCYLGSVCGRATQTIDKSSNMMQVTVASFIVDVFSPLIES